MRITRNQLQDLINEEISRALLDVSNKRLVEAVGWGGKELMEVPAHDLLDFAKRYAKLGGAVQEQLHSLVADSMSQVNPNAVDTMKEFIGGYNSEIDAAIQDWEMEEGYGSPTGEEPSGPDNDPYFRGGD